MPFPALAQRDARVPDPDPELERKTFKLPDGIEANLFAADPLLMKPIQINFDSAGRLNVAITRAKHRMIVVSSMRGEDIDLGKTSARGVEMLREFLKYAERGPAALRAAIAQGNQQDFDSPFEKEVAEELEKRGLRVDRLRQEVLESPQWRVCRVWSTDWMRDRDKQVARVLNALERARKELQTSETPPTTQASDPSRLPAIATAILSLKQPAEKSYDSIDDVPEEVIRSHVLALRRCGATERDDLIRGIARELGFERTGPKIKERINCAIEQLMRANQVTETSDGRLVAVERQSG